MTTFETYIALLKAYCALSMLVMPKAFQNGGWAASMTFQIASAVLTTICAFKLIQSGLKLKIYSYSLVIEAVLGIKGRIALDIMIALTQISFAISHQVFIIESMKTTVDKAFDLDTNHWVYAVGLIVILTPVAWVRNIARFAFTYLVGIILIFWCVIVVSGYAISTLRENKELGPEIKAINSDGYLTTLGMTVYCYEGIGMLMPIMHASESPEKLEKTLIAAIVTLTVFYVGFSELCYMAWGSGLNRPIVTEMLPADSGLVVVTKMLYCINLLCTYAICINPTNKILEKAVFRCKRLKKKSKTRFWLKNLQRFAVVVLGVFLAVTLAHKMDKFLGLMGALLCAPLALTMPALLHLKLLAQSKREKLFDISILFISFVVLVFSTI